mgnify:CR=1 FL=1
MLDFDGFLRPLPSGTPWGSRGGGAAWRGPPYKPMDRFSTWLIWGSAIFVALGVCAINTVAVIPWVLVGIPFSVGLACLFAKMAERTWFSRVIALLYMVTALLGLLLYSNAG